MTNKPMLSVKRELLERIARPQLKPRDETVRRRAITELRALLDKPEKFECLDGGKCGIGGYCDACPHTKPAAQHQGEPVARVRQSPVKKHVSIDLLRTDLKHGQLLYAEQPVPVSLTVWYGSMPESNGKTNWTAILHRKGEAIWSGAVITIDRSEYPDRVRYEADRMRYLIGELTEEPDILAYDDKLHSGYVKPEQPAPVAVVMPERELYTKYLVGVIPNNANEVNAYKDGWNTCLEEVSRLNGVKP